MINFKSISDIDEYYKGWEAVRTANRIRYCCPPELGKGYVDIIGDINTAFVCIADYTCYQNSLVRSYQQQRTIAIGESQPSKGHYYRNKEHILSLEAGINCRINAIPTVLYSRIADNVAVKSTGFIITETFLNNIPLQQYDLEQMAFCLNDKPVYNKELLLICKQLNKLPVSSDIIPLYLKAKAIEIVSLLMDLTLEERNKPRLSKDNLDSIKTVKKYIDSHYVNPLSIEELSKKFYINKNLLQAGLKSLTGHTVYAYITYQRMNRSVELLTSSTMSINDIAIEVGYKSKANFYKAFKKIFLVSPNHLRKNQHDVSFI